eukprot:5631021-Pyramimonas_sp.AAC.1
MGTARNGRGVRVCRLPDMHAVLAVLLALTSFGFLVDAGAICSDLACLQCGACSVRISCRQCRKETARGFLKATIRYLRASTACIM